MHQWYVENALDVPMPCEIPYCKKYFMYFVHTQLVLRNSSELPSTPMLTKPALRFCCAVPGIVWGSCTCCKVAKQELPVHSTWHSGQDLVWASEPGQCLHLSVRDQGPYWGQGKLQEQWRWWWCSCNFATANPPRVSISKIAGAKAVDQNK